MAAIKARRAWLTDSGVVNTSEMSVSTITTNGSSVAIFAKRFGPGLAIVNPVFRPHIVGVGSSYFRNSFFQYSSFSRPSDCNTSFNLIVNQGSRLFISAKTEAGSSPPLNSS
jgi:hypothetical protein